jgi:hypothetical protein
LSRSGRSSIDNSTSRAARMRRGGAPLGWGAALAAFALLCGLLMLLSRDAPEAIKITAADHVEQALDETKSAGKALKSQNYGEVNAALKRLQATLKRTLARLRPPKSGAGLPAETPR